MKKGDELAPCSIIKLHKNHIRGTKKGAIVKNFTLFLCNITNAVQAGGKISCQKVYINSKVLKHLYDKRPSFEYDFVLTHLPTLIKYPNLIYKNSHSKRGTYCFVKEIDDTKYLVSVEESVEQGENCLFVITCFSVEDKYLKKFPILWSWRGGDPSS